MKKSADILKIKSLLLVLLIALGLGSQSLLWAAGSGLHAGRSAEREVSRQKDSSSDKSDENRSELSEYNGFHAIVKVGVELPSIKWLSDDFSGFIPSAELFSARLKPYFSSGFSFTASTFFKRLFRYIISPMPPKAFLISL